MKNIKKILLETEIEIRFRLFLSTLSFSSLFVASRMHLSRDILLIAILFFHFKLLKVVIYTKKIARIKNKLLHCETWSWFFLIFLQTLSFQRIEIRKMHFLILLFNTQLNFMFYCTLRIEKKSKCRDGFSTTTTEKNSFKQITYNYRKNCELCGKQ